ncbi:hypothetical protein B484DRAFT_456169, partial [Ochromonadaceae sp. CCMP2298]
MAKIEEEVNNDKAQISKLKASVEELLEIVNDMKKTCLTSGYSKKMWKYESFLTMLITRQLQQTVSAKNIGTTKTIKMVAERWGICVACMLDGRAPESVIFAAGVKGVAGHRKPGPKGVGGKCVNPYLAATGHYEKNKGGQHSLAFHRDDELNVNYMVVTDFPSLATLTFTTHQRNDTSGKHVWSFAGDAKKIAKDDELCEDVPSDVMVYLRDIYASRKQVSSYEGPPSSEEE